MRKKIRLILAVMLLALLGTLMKTGGALAGESEEGADVFAGQTDIDDSTALAPGDTPEANCQIRRADSAAGFLSILSQMDDDVTKRLSVLTEDDLSVNASLGVYYDGTYVLEFKSTEERDEAIAGLLEIYGNEALLKDKTLSVDGIDPAIEEIGDIIEIKSENDEGERKESSVEIIESETKDAAPVIEETEAPETEAPETEAIEEIDETEPETIEAIEETEPDAASKIPSPIPEPCELRDEAGGILVAIIDTGVNTKEVLNVKASINLTDDSDEDKLGHGTDMAKYVLGFAPDAEILSIKAFNDEGKGSLSNISAAIKYAGEAGADYMLLAFSGTDSDSATALKEEVSKAIDEGICVVSSAGNKARRASRYIPAGIKGVITAGSMDSEGNLREFSNYGDAIDYFVVSDSTSEAAARLLGMLVCAGGDDRALIAFSELKANGTRDEAKDSPEENEETESETEPGIELTAFTGVTAFYTSSCSISFDSSTHTLTLYLKIGRHTNMSTIMVYLCKDTTRTYRILNYGNKTKDHSGDPAFGSLEVTTYSEYLILTLTLSSTSDINKLFSTNKLYYTGYDSDDNFEGWLSLSDIPGYSEAKKNCDIYNGNYTYTVSFDAAGGEGEMDDMSCKTNTNYTLPANAFSKAGCTFAGWNTEADGSGTFYEDGATIKDLSTTNGAVVTLYAMWEGPSYADVTITNEVSGNMASYDDEFKINISLGDEVQELIMKQGDEKTLEACPIGQTIIISPVDEFGYISTAERIVIGEEGEEERTEIGSEGIEIPAEGLKINIIHTKEVSIPTLVSGINEIMAAALLIISGFSLLIYRKFSR